MTASNPHPLIESAARWALHYAKRAPGPLFATPCFYFTVDSKGLPNSQSIHFVHLADACNLPPEALLRRAKHLRHPPSTSAAVLVYALDPDGEIYTDAVARPAQFLVYTYVPSGMGKPLLERRIVTDDGTAAAVGPDQQLPFDRRATMVLANEPSRHPATVTIPAGASIH